MRLTKNQIQQIKDRFKVDTLWSWSRFNLYHNDPYGYYLKYIKHEKETLKDSIWGISGGFIHDTLEQFYTGKLKREELLQDYEDKLMEMQVMELKYNKVDKEMNDKIANKYENSIRHFFENYKEIKTKTIVEQLALIKIGKYLFQGYIDFLHLDNEGNYIIEDFKTSTIYTGDKKDNEAGQLILYAQALIQKGVPYNKVKLRWNFLKYCTIRYNHMINVTYFKDDKNGGKITTSCCLKNEWVSKIATQLKKDYVKYLEHCNTTKTNKEITNLIKQCKENNSLDLLPKEVQSLYILSDVEKIGVRCEWVDKISNQLKKDLKNIGIEDELEQTDLIQKCIEVNNLSPLSKEIQDNYTLDDCYVYIDFNEEVVNKLNNRIIDTLDVITNNTQKTKELIDKQNKLDISSMEYKTTTNEIDEMWWTDIDGSKEYYFYNLCGYNRNQHKPWNQYLNDLKAVIDDKESNNDNFENLFNESNDNKVINKDEDLGWLKDLM